ncbi:MAG: sigma factor, partial [Acidimicrobiia bacterium]
MTAAGGGAAELARADRDVVLADLHREHYRSLVRLACLLLDEQGAGEEVVQEAFVRVFQAWPKV